MTTLEIHCYRSFRVNMKDLPIMHTLYYIESKTLTTCPKQECCPGGFEYSGDFILVPQTVPRHEYEFLDFLKWDKKRVEILVIREATPVEYSAYTAGVNSRPSPRMVYTR